MERPTLARLSSTFTSGAIWLWLWLSVKLPQPQPHTRICTQTGQRTLRATQVRAALFHGYVATDRT
jgi:hypothetical protein